MHTYLIGDITGSCNIPQLVKEEEAQEVEVKKELLFFLQKQAAETRTTTSIMMPKLPPVFAYVTQGRTEHLVTIIDKMVLKMLKDGKNPQSENAGWGLDQLDQQSKIQIKWNNTGAKQPVVVSSVKLMDLENEDRFSGASAGGARGRSSRSRRSSASTPSPATSVASASAATEPVPGPLKKRRKGVVKSEPVADDVAVPGASTAVHAVVHAEMNNNNNNDNSIKQIKSKQLTINNEFHSEIFHPRFYGCRCLINRKHSSSSSS
mmetsp:Transcript_56518/g.63282  ORF Transcript_56518/g.63282 Transcript_56518/m.63282 type:complete len:263 (-) Transcript_56518:477-1265(-)